MSEEIIPLDIAKQAETHVEVTDSGNHIRIEQVQEDGSHDHIYLNRDAARTLGRWLLRVTDVTDSEWVKAVSKIRKEREGGA